MFRPPSRFSHSAAGFESWSRTSSLSWKSSQQSVFQIEACGACSRTVWLELVLNVCPAGFYSGACSAAPGRMGGAGAGFQHEAQHTC